MAHEPVSRPAFNLKEPGKMRLQLLEGDHHAIYGRRHGTLPQDLETRYITFPDVHLCDQEHPECKRCQRVKLACPGYRQETDLIFVNVSSQVRERGSSQRRRHSRQSTNDTVVVQVEGNRRGRLTTFSSACSPACTPLHQTDWNQHALCRFMAEFTLSTDDMRKSPGFLHNLPQLYHEARERDPLLDHAVMAVALAHLSNQSGSCDAAGEARRLYGLSISLLNKELSDGNLQSETTLIAVLFLNYYLVFGDERPTSDVWSIHSDALSMLLRTRGTSSQFLNPKVGGMARSAVYISVYRNLTRRILPGAEVALFDESLTSYTDIIWAATSLALSRITRLLCQCDELLSKEIDEDQPSAALLDLIFQMSDEDHRYPEDYSHVVLDPDHLDATFFDVVWTNSWRAARITLLQSLVDLILHAHSCDDLQPRYEQLEQLRQTAEEIILSMTDEISTSTSRLLAEFEVKRSKANRYGEPIGCVAIAYFMSLAPLGVALGVKTLSEQQKVYIGSQLAVVSGKIGLNRPVRERWPR
ncbi:hypothetical protein VTL71DRAFT_3540 [Oculimacula yallundae]|uniref:Zn(2)-C6 fungal-type domain-containing protein n=1 Tax=Oculimacula yallundae TaxID=86028 RepID=A0ABR4C7I4_9HELO